MKNDSFFMPWGTARKKTKKKKFENDPRVLGRHRLVSELRYMNT